MKSSSNVWTYGVLIFLNLHYVETWDVADKELQFNSLICAVHDLCQKYQYTNLKCSFGLMRRDVTMRKYGYSVRGIPPRDHRLLARGTRYSAIPVMSMQGILDVQFLEGTTNAEMFITKTVYTSLLMAATLIPS